MKEKTLVKREAAVAPALLTPSLVEKMLTERQQVQVVKFRTTCTDCMPNYCPVPRRSRRECDGTDVRTVAPRARGVLGRGAGGSRRGGGPGSPFAAVPCRHPVVG